MAIPGASTDPTQAARSSQVLARLSARELEVLRALTTGARSEMIARNLGISPKTLRNHISSIYHKLGIFDRAQAVIVAVREGLVEILPP
jgi:DNA-binding NarL/FixJ family response regulator